MWLRMSAKCGHLQRDFFESHRSPQRAIRLGFARFKFRIISVCLQEVDAITIDEHGISFVVDEVHVCQFVFTLFA